MAAEHDPPAADNGLDAAIKKQAAKLALQLEALKLPALDVEAELRQAVQRALIAEAAAAVVKDQGAKNVINRTVSAKGVTW